MLSLLALALATAQAGDVDAGGTISVTARVGTNDCLSTPAQCQWMSFGDAAVFSPWVTANPAANISTKAKVDLRFHGPSKAASLPEVQDSALRQPGSLRVRDAWIATQGAHLDTQFGVQRIAWGVANGISVVDTINPFDLTDPTRFDRRLSTLSARMTVHGEQLSLTAVGVPFFVPAALPQTDVQVIAGAQDVFAEEGLIIEALDTRASTPTNGLADTGGALQLRWTPAYGDLALSFSRARDSLPQVDGDVLLVGYQTQSDKVDVGIPLSYPMLNVAGLTARGELPGSINSWAEVALVMPQRTVAQPSEAQLQSLIQLGTLDAMPDPLPRTITQDGEPFARWIVGADREFGPIRLTAQWLHGFFTERSADQVNDYGLVSAQLGIRPTMRLDASTASDLQGWLSDVALTWLYADALQMSLGLTHIAGPSQSAFGGLKNASGGRIHAQVAF